MLYRTYITDCSFILDADNKMLIQKILEALFKIKLKYFPIKKNIEVYYVKHKHFKFHSTYSALKKEEVLKQFEVVLINVLN